LKGDKRKAHKDAITGLAFDYAVLAARCRLGSVTGRRQHSPLSPNAGGVTPQLFQALVTNGIEVRVDRIRQNVAAGTGSCTTRSN
jgi:hypothetical protein